ncbi:hypothetical protein WR25_22525 [Diploscapter pachys]|uniref:Uncharacterized protein n=1 Tax=Diploscapter pachys TaxID=2018661 RepID=A0A2A2JY07_9BILA|nr:hypothetical protein WR25_22525 [Diploscapter pachys]
MVDERAQWMKEHYIAFENGSKIYYWPDENGVWQMEGLGVWHEHMLNKEIRYEYGVGSAWLNYCFPRDFIPEEEWLASIFRSMQHKASVQSTSVVSWLIVYIYPSSEVFHSLSLFAITELQMYQDDKYFFLVQPAFFVFTVTLLMKLIVNSIMEMSSGLADNSYMMKAIQAQNSGNPEIKKDFETNYSLKDIMHNS